jgi:UDP-N-acetyl-D-galactosamine dehydrogenase
LRNSKAIELIAALASFGLHVMASDACSSVDEAAREGVTLVDASELVDLDLLVLAVPHREYLVEPEFVKRLRPDGVFGDIRGAFRQHTMPSSISYWSL